MKDCRGIQLKVGDKVAFGSTGTIALGHGVVVRITKSHKSAEVEQTFPAHEAEIYDYQKRMYKKISVSERKTKSMKRAAAVCKVSEPVDVVVKQTAEPVISPLDSCFPGLVDVRDYHDLGFLQDLLQQIDENFVVVEIDSSNDDDWNGLYRGKVEFRG